MSTQGRGNRGGGRAKGRGKGKGKGKGKSQSKSKKTKKSDRDYIQQHWGSDWVTHVDNRFVCKRYVMGMCKLGQNCSGWHGCPIPKSDGKPCGEKHAYWNCPLYVAPEGARTSY